MNRNYSTISYAESPFGTLSEFMSKSFGWMFAGLLVTFAVFGYAVLNGLNLSAIFLVYDYGSLILAFLVGAVYFGVMAVYGNVTNRDLTGWGPKLMGGLIALIVCSLVGGLFAAFGMSFGVMDLVLCAVGLLIFMGLTAYDTQMLKYYYSYFGGDAAMLHKASIIGALNLYLDFINIFLYCLLYTSPSPRYSPSQRPDRDFCRVFFVAHIRLHG